MASSSSSAASSTASETTPVLSDAQDRGTALGVAPPATSSALGAAPAASSSTVSYASSGSATAPVLSDAYFPPLPTTPARGRGTSPPATTWALGTAPAASSSSTFLSDADFPALPTTLSRGKGTALGVTSAASSSRGAASKPTYVTTAWGTKGRVPDPSGATFLAQSSSRSAARRGLNRGQGSSMTAAAGYEGFESAPDPTSSTMPAACSSSSSGTAWTLLRSSRSAWCTAPAAANGALNAGTSSASYFPSHSTAFAGLDTSFAPAVDASSTSSAGPSNITPVAAMGAQTPATFLWSFDTVDWTYSSFQDPGCGSVSGAEAAGPSTDYATGSVGLLQQQTAAMDPLESAWAHVARLNIENVRLMDDLQEARRVIEDLLEGKREPDTLPSRERCCDCLIGPAIVQVAPCDRICLCEACYSKRQACPFCTAWINWQSTDARRRRGSHRRSRSS